MAAAELAPPTLDDVFDAQARIAPYLDPTPLRECPPLSRLVGAEIRVKHESFLPTCAFKVRGGVNLVAQLSDEERAAGLVGASTGNHGQSLAYAARAFGVRATIFVPEGANPGKVEAIRDLGAEVVPHGRDFDEAREHCALTALSTGARYVHSGDEPHLIAGVGTAYVELLQAWPEVDVVIVPVGGGSGAAGACIAGKGLKPSLRVIGVQSEAAPAARRSWLARRLLEDEMRTSAEGLATRTAFALPQRIMWDGLDDFVLVSDESIARATRLMIASTHTLVEHAGAAPLAAALLLRDELAGRRVALVASGGNITPAQLLDVLR